MYSKPIRIIILSGENDFINGKELQNEQEKIKDEEKKDNDY